MTDHKHLKARIRERVARTGESYTTARRHVLAGNATAVAGETGYDTFGGGQHQPSTLLRHLLHRDGIELSEAMLCGLGGGIGFMVAVFDYRGLPPILTIVAQHHSEPWLPAALGRLGAGFDEAHSGYARGVEERLLAALRGTGGTPAAEQPPADPILTDAARRELFDELAGLVEAARRDEEAAVAALRA
ncbi:hypothetical protein [Dactylosporangium sp. CA-092794]|uniref:hypothetical protein n=1 Tax=Dactylosporangium sp. CA-092794 TaxID=3239929 RepID=UPI003D9028C8